MDENRVRYAGLDFDTHFDDELARLQVKFASSFNDFSMFSLGIVLLDMVAYGLDTLSFYLDRRATDAYLQTARSRRAVARLTRQLGYKMRPAVASSTDVLVGVSVAQSVTVPVPRGFKLKGPNDLVFETARAVSFSPAEQGSGRTKRIPVYEGETFTETFVSAGTANQVFTLRRVPAGKFVVFGSVTVTVNGGAWTEKEFIAFEKTNHFEVGYNDDPATVRFGDGVAGNIPMAGATIAISYVATSGKAGQVLRGTIVKELVPLVVAGTAVPLTVTNPEGSTGGDDWEDLDHAKVYAPKVFKTRMVAVTREDYEALSNSYADPLFGKVAVSQALATRSAVGDLALRSLVDRIAAVMAALVPAISSSVVSGHTRLTDIESQMTTINDSLAAVGLLTTAANTALTSAITTSRSSKERASDVVAAVVGISSQVTDGKAAIDAISTAGSDGLQASTKADLKAYFDRITTRSADANAAALTVAANVDSEINYMSTAKAQLSSVGLSVSQGRLLVLSNAGAVVLADVGASSTTGLRGDLASIYSVLTSTDTNVANALADIVAHVDAILAADCNANLVTVPILSRDAAGFYTAPPTGLVSSLQAFLDARKEVTQTVVVSSGADFLVRPVIRVRFGITRAVSTSVAKATVSSTIDGVLRDRKFGASLYVSDLINPIRAIFGVAFVNVAILGHVVSNSTDVSKLDASGNLIISSTEVITKLVDAVTILDPEVVDV